MNGSDLCLMFIQTKFIVTHFIGSVTVEGKQKGKYKPGEI